MAIIAFGSKGAQFLSKLWDMFVLNFLWLLGSLPVLTLGVSTLAAYRVCLKMVEDEDPEVAREFVRAYRESLSQGLALTLLCLFCGSSALLSFFLFEALQGNPMFMLMIGFTITTVGIIHALYLFPLTARYKNSIYQHLCNSREIFFHYFAKTLGCLLLVALEIWVFFFNGLVLIYLGFFVAPVLVMATVSAFAMKIFRDLEQTAGKLEPVATGHT